MTDRAKSDRETWWVLRAQSGDREALNELLKSIQEPLYRYISTLVRERTPAEDILQEVFIRIYRKYALVAYAIVEFIVIALLVYSKVRR